MGAPPTTMLMMMLTLVDVFLIHSLLVMVQPPPSVPTPFPRIFPSSGEPQWERPADFVPMIRENPYTSTLEQEFLKSVLSPKRSRVRNDILSPKNRGEVERDKGERFEAGVGGRTSSSSIFMPMNLINHEQRDDGHDYDYDHDHDDDHDH